MTTSEATPITDQPRDEQAPATTRPLTVEETSAQLDVIVAALRELGRELKAERLAKEAA